MSIRQYRPRGNNRNGISGKQNFLLYLLLAIAIGTQIAYPLIHDEKLRIDTLLVVYFGAATMLLHSLLSYGFRYFISLFLHWGSSTSELKPVGLLEHIRTMHPSALPYLEFH